MILVHHVSSVSCQEPSKSHISVWTMSSIVSGQSGCTKVCEKKQSKQYKHLINPSQRGFRKYLAAFGSQNVGWLVGESFILDFTPGLLYSIYLFFFFLTTKGFWLFLYSSCDAQSIPFRFCGIPQLPLWVRHIDKWKKARHLQELVKQINNRANPRTRYFWTSNYMFFFLVCFF